MSNTEIQSKVNELRELRRMADELTAEIESIQDAIKAHMTVIMRKLGVGNRTQVALIAQHLAIESDTSITASLS